MLKIKDNVTYQKLNALGFRLDDFNDCYSYEADASTIISVYKDNKQVTITYLSGYEIVEQDEIEDITFEELYFYCPKLKDLVEKVED